jgi:DNA-binding NarL/FixJ family response regulator
MKKHSRGFELPAAGYVLIVDDDEEARGAVADALSRLGRRVVEVSTGEDALEAAERARPALAITEVLLPTTSGYEVCRALKERFGEEFPVIFISAERTHVADRVAGLLIGADEYLVRPVNPEELIVRVQHLLQRTESSQEQRRRLTPREEEVLELLVEGCDQAEISECLVIAPRTVSKHVEHILAKFGVHSRAQAVALALRGTALTPPPPERRQRVRSDAR